MRAFKNGIFGFLLFSVVGCGRQVEQDEIVLHEMIVEKNGIYYYGDCYTHATTLYTGTDTFFFHENGNIKGTYTIKKGLPDKHWEQFNLDGSKKLDLYFDNGKLVKKIMH
jgi:antitoxin component YwqK of YwqJK toxin-antitoxin module